LFSPLNVPVPHRGRHDYGRSALIGLTLIVRLFASSDKCDMVYLWEDDPVGIPGYLFEDAGQAAGGAAKRIRPRRRTIETQPTWNVNGNAFRTFPKLRPFAADSRQGRG
jgi:hypothetical protein